MLTFRQRPDTRVILALIVALFLAVVVAGWAMRAGRVRNIEAPTPAPPGAPGRRARVAHRVRPHRSPRRRNRSPRSPPRRRARRGG
jgi:uncharacterized protein (DUF58 family)